MQEIPAERLGFSFKNTSVLDGILMDSLNPGAFYRYITYGFA